MKLIVYVRSVSVLTSVGLGSTIRLCGRACSAPDLDQRAQLLEDREDRHPEGNVISAYKFLLGLTLSTVDGEVHRRPGQGDAWRDRQLLLR